MNKLKYYFNKYAPKVLGLIWCACLFLVSIYVLLKLGKGILIVLGVM